MTKDEADNALHQAIITHAQVYKIIPEDCMLNEFAVVAHWQKIQDGGTSDYTMQFHKENVPNHVAVGLFRVAEQLSIGDAIDGD